MFANVLQRVCVIACVYVSVCMRACVMYLGC